MFSAALFDLDGTLLPLDTDAFIKAYVADVARFVAPHLPPEKFVPRLFSATQAMLEDRDPARTNQDVFMDHFFTGLDVPPGRLLPVFEAYYRERFPALRRLSGPPDPAARAAVEAALRAGIRVVIATNPLFPAMAIEERMRWAGVADLPYSLVTSYEHMHFCKPNPAYYAEVAERIGAPPETCLMVGNDAQEDGAAKLAGMTVFLVEDWLVDRGAGPAPDHRGRLADVVSFLAQAGPLARRS